MSQRRSIAARPATHNRAPTGVLSSTRQQFGVPLRSSAVATLREAIIEHLLPPGRRLVEDEIASQLNISRNPVREAFRTLEQEGWLVGHSGLGVYVAEPSKEELTDLFEVRSVLEVFATRLAATHASLTQLARLTELVAEARRTTSAPESSRVGTEFHRVIAEASGNRAVVEILTTMSDKIRWVLSSVGSQRLAGSWKEHEQLVDAVRSRNSNLAGRLARHHAEETKAAYLRLVGAKGVRQIPAGVR